MPYLKTLVILFSYYGCLHHTQILAGYPPNLIRAKTEDTVVYSATL